MKVVTKELGSFSVNCHICYDEQSLEAVIVDPGDCAEQIISYISDTGLKPLSIIITHAHFDHICAVPAIKEKYGIPVCIIEHESKQLADSRNNLSAFAARSGVVSITADILLKDGETYAPFSNGTSFKVIHTPGHTEGGACFYCKEHGFIFTGDTLFYRSIGRADLPTGNEQTLLASIKEKLMCLDDETVVYAGHGSTTTIGEERMYNQFLA